MRMLVDPAQEWAEMFDNAWRLERDLFYSPVMNGQDWPAVREKYRRLLPLLGSREDLNYLIGQVIGEIGNSHTYVGDGDDGETGPAVHAALLGVDWALDPASGRYRIANIYPGDNTRDDYRSPLTQPGLDVKAGDYVLAVNGVDLRAPAEPDSLLQLSDPDAVVDLTVADSPAGATRHVVVKPIKAELSLREAAWIAHNRAVVDKLSGGRVGYVYMSDMEQLGIQQFLRQFYAQLDKQALIMDDRWNGGGFIAPFALERLRRVLVTLDVNRESAISTEPEEVLNGPKVALLNHWSASDGDIFPYLFHLYGLGKLVGTRSWGGVRGIRGYWQMMDGGFITIPEDAVYTLDSKWSVENHGVDPDVEIENQPADLLAGHDAQLETAVDMMMKAIAGKPAGLPPAPPLIPAYPGERHRAAAALNLGPGPDAPGLAPFEARPAGPTDLEGRVRLGRRGPRPPEPEDQRGQDQQAEGGAAHQPAEDHPCHGSQHLAAGLVAAHRQRGERQQDQGGGEQDRAEAVARRYHHRGLGPDRPLAARLGLHA